ncbi:DUF523 domain-containing protein [Campylobacter mucosalis]|uniref:Putative DUF523 domain protein n=1 Tax=Campylobacter mucosalis CCUG 21559 TaxID=1032067 RepID=A0A6G5QHX5_9BACT|nr:DUF523 domain-containing protein [Campylobacter mucosalis]QCD45261.1 putative DUF523 domain protein [Campylobacter mucosalis CCUG 21559]
MAKDKILISACLLGKNCKYNGLNNQTDEVAKECEILSNTFELIAVCPEELGGLDTPREPAEILDEKVITEFSKLDVTKEFLKGAKKCVNIAKQNSVNIAVLKAKSPSCGSGYIYDGSFSKTLIKKDGLTAKALKENGVKIYTENEICKINKGEF